MHDHSHPEIRIEREVRAMGGVGSTMVNPLQAPVLIDEEAESVGRGIPVRQDEPGGHLLDDLRPTVGPGLEVAHPQCEVVHRRVDATGSHRTAEVQYFPETPIIFRPVTHGAVGNNEKAVRAYGRVVHSKRSEHVLGHPHRERLIGDALDDDREKSERGVVVVEFGARGVL